MKRRTLLQQAGLATFGLALPAWAQTAAATRLLVGAPPGGGTDILGRALAQEMGKQLARTVIVENRPGAGGNIAALGVAKSAPDSGTLLLSYTSHVINPALYKKLPFDPVADFTPIVPIATAPSILLVSAKCPARNLQELVAMARDKPGTMNVAIAGLGGANHLAGEMLRKMAQIDVLGIPYKGTSGALTDLMAGQVDIVFSGYGAAGGLIKSGRVKALAVTSAARMAALPQVPPVADLLPGFDYSAWYGLFGPAGMAAKDVDALRVAAHAAQQSAGLREQLEREGMDLLQMETPAFRSFLQAELGRWKLAVKASGVELM